MPTKSRTTNRGTLQKAKREAQQAKAQADQARYRAEAQAWKQIENSYKGGVPTRTSEPWTAGGGGYRFGSAQDRHQLQSSRDRGIHAHKNNPVAQTILQTETDNVIGDGLNYQPTTDSEDWNREAKDRYYEWLDDCTLRGGDIYSGCEAQRMIWEQSRAAGDAGWVLVNRDDGGRIDSRIQLIPSDKIRTPDKFASDPNVFDGIRYDQWGRPVTFYVYSNNERTGRREFPEVMARDFVYLPHMRSMESPRGETCFLTSFDMLAHLDRYIDGVSLAAWMATVFGIVFKQENAAKQLAALPTLSDSQGIDRRAVTMESGMVKFTGAKDEVVQVQAHQPMMQTPEFIRTMMRTLGQPFDMPIEVIFKDMSTCTFASARIGLLPFYRSCRIKAARFASRWSRTIRWWLSRESQRAPDDPKRWKTKFPARFWPHELMVNAWTYTDPTAEAQGDLLEMDMKTKSPQMVIEERGRDAAKIIKDWEEWNKLTKDLPTIHSTLSRDPTPEPVEAPAEPVGGRMAESGNGNGRE